MLCPKGQVSLFKKKLLNFLFKAAPVEYGSSRARGRIRAAAEAYTTPTVTWDPNFIFNLKKQFEARQGP